MAAPKPCDAPVITASLPERSMATLMGCSEVWLASDAKASVSERLARFAQVVWNAASLDEIRFVEKIDNE